MYNAYITRIKNLHKHPNADRLQIGECFGNAVIVSMDYEDNQLGVYFPSDGQVSLEFAEANNLLRKKDDAGNNIGGYMDPDKRNVTAIKLRGEKSDGLFLPLKSLESFGDITTLKEGDRIDIFSGHEICRRYIPLKQHRQGGYSVSNKTRKKKVPVAPLFAEHADTEQLAYNLSAFKPDDEIEITLKMHGCFSSENKVNMWDGTTKKISKITRGDVVVGYKDGQFVPTTVLDTFTNGKTNEWVDVYISRNGYNGERIRHIECTPNHKFYDFATNTYKEIKDFNIGDVVYTTKHGIALTEEQKAIIVGMILGDGSICRSKYNTCIEWSQKKDHEEYVDYLLLLLSNVLNKQEKIYTSGYGTKMIRARTINSFDIDSLVDEITKDTNLKFNENIVKYFSPLSLCVLYLDDGSLCHSDKQRDRAIISVCDYTDEECNIILKCLNKFGINGVLSSSQKIKNKDKLYNSIRLNTKDAYKMFELISDYVPDCMRYKLPQEFSDRRCKNLQYFGYETLFLLPNVINNMNFKRTKRNKNKYDIHTETNNYMINNCLVHNSSQRTGYLPVLKGYKRTFIDKILHREGKPIYDWGYVSGTRRTVLESYDGGYYGDNAFREQHSKLFEGKLNKGESVYYEVVGFTTSGTPIMGNGDNKKLNDKDFVKQYGEVTQFSYGCAPNVSTTKDENGNIPCLPQSDIYVYRMTMTNEDGFVVEYTPDFMRYRCEQMGVKTVPVFAKVILPSEEYFDEEHSVGNYVKEMAEQYYDGPDPIGKTHIREGVVVRIINRPKFCAYKYKNWYFKALSGISLDNVNPDSIDSDILSEM